MPFLAHCLNYLKRKTSHWSKVLNKTIWGFSQTTSNYWPQGLQNAALQQGYSPCWSQNPNFRGIKENNFPKNPNLASQKFSELFSPKTTEPICFQKSCIKISSNWSFQGYVSFDLERAQTCEHCSIL